MEPHNICLAFGANLGERLEALRAARVALARWVEFSAVSPVFETAPLYVTDQPAFLNAVALGTTALAPLVLLRVLQDTETELGRRPTFRYGPRVIDLDLIFYDDVRSVTPELCLPHPRLHERAFVLRPLAAVAPEWVHPVTGVNVRAMLEALPGDDGARVVAEAF